ncbi:hypothetical protein N9B43_06450 [Mariniblastus sp.]|nr:hypothetical protein [Mariniblastus sp.]
MLIEIQCENVSSFDATVGKYVECGEKIIVSGEKAGETIECTKCSQPIEIPLPGEVRSASSSSRDQGREVSKSATPERAKLKAREQRSGQPRRSQQTRRTSEPRRRSAQSEGKPKSQDGGVLKTKQRPGAAATNARAKSSTGRRSADGSVVAKTKGTQSKGTQSKGTQSPVSKSTGQRPVSKSTGQRAKKVTGAGNVVPKPSGNTDRRQQRRRKPTDSVSGRSDIMALDFKSQEVSKGLVGDQQERCKKCGNLVENARCVVCFFVDSKFEKLHCPLPDIEIQVTGCQRWLQQTMSEGVSVKFIALAGNLLVGAMAVMLGGISALFLMGLGFGPVVGGLLLFLTIVSTCFYLGLLFKCRQFMHKPVAQLAWFQKPFWRLLLFFARFMKWERYDSALRGRRVIRIRDRMFGDNDIMEQKGIKNVQVLDIQGTNLTDRGLLNLYDLKHLQCVVLRGTKVSPEAVFRFQQTFPRLWIWY